MGDIILDSQRGEERKGKLIDHLHPVDQLTIAHGQKVGTMLDFSSRQIVRPYNFHLLRPVLMNSKMTSLISSGDVVIVKLCFKEPNQLSSMSYYRECLRSP